MGSSWCGAGCDQPWLPDAPENAMKVEVYDAETQTLLDTQTSQSGRINMHGSGGNYSKDLLLHVVGPTLEATYAYRLQVAVRSYDGEDECEC